MPNPLEALQQFKLKASQDPRLKDVEVKQSIMPFIPGSGVLEGLKGAAPKVKSVFQAMKEAGTFGGSRLNPVVAEGKFGLSSVPTEAAKTIPKLGRMNPEFTAVGEEAAYNAVKFPRIAKSADDIEAAYQRILASMMKGRVK
jgi:hypothetical protein